MTQDNLEAVSAAVAVLRPGYKPPTRGHSATYCPCEITFTATPADASHIYLQFHGNTHMSNMSASADAPARG